MPVAFKSDCRHGRFLYLPNDSMMGQMLTGYGEYSEEEVRLFRQIVRPGDIVIEAGACIGVHTIPLARMVGSDGLVMAYEPQRPLYYLLCGNIALNGLHNQVMAFNQAVGSLPGKVNVPTPDYEAKDNFGGRPVGGASGEAVEMVCLDSMPIEKLRLIKADVQGMETDVLIGASRLITRFHPFLYVENDQPEQSPRLLGLMLNMNYKLYWHCPFYVPHDGKQFSMLASINVLGIPRDIDADVPNAVQITSPKDAPPGRWSNPRWPSS